MDGFQTTVYEIFMRSLLVIYTGVLPMCNAPEGPPSTTYSFNILNLNDKNGMTTELSQRWPEKPLCKNTTFLFLINVKETPGSREEATRGIGRSGIAGEGTAIGSARDPG
jgi:hypothetical protein